MPRCNQLAATSSKLVIKATQPDEAARNILRDIYANDPDMLIGFGQVVATEFSAITAANNY